MCTLLLSLLAMTTLPIPTFLLDMLFTFNISLALIVVLATVYAQRPLDFAVFPTILLVSTLMRLARKALSGVARYCNLFAKKSLPSPEAVR